MISGWSPVTLICDREGSIEKATRKDHYRQQLIITPREELVFYYRVRGSDIFRPMIRYLLSLLRLYLTGCLTIGALCWVMWAFEIGFTDAYSQSAEFLSNVSSTLRGANEEDRSD